LTVTINPDKIKDHIQEYNGNKYVKLNINISDTPDQYGKDVKITIDTYKPARSADSVFGVSGACFLARVSALQAVAFADGTVFDELYGTYKEDVDLAWRLQSSGARAAVLFGVVVYHARGTKAVHEAGDLTTYRNKRNQSALVRYLSYRNHLMTIYKNEYWQNMVLDWPWILWYEAKKFLYNLIFDTRVLYAFGYMWQHRRELSAKRAFIRQHRMVNWKSVRRLWRRHWVDESFGVVLARHDNKSILYLLIKQQDGAWQFPKGHPNSGESAQDTARRELWEETGITPERMLDVSPLTVSYKFRSGVDMIYKKVCYFLATTTSDMCKIDNNEVLDALWLPYDAAMAQLTYVDHKRVLRKAQHTFESSL
jgi:8-oxo-dGTP pyrophosphatase MutT (NUDIX family)